MRGAQARLWGKGYGAVLIDLKLRPEAMVVGEGYPALRAAPSSLPAARCARIEPSRSFILPHMGRIGDKPMSNEG